jgi:nicotinamidase-related amidase
VSETKNDQQENAPDNSEIVLVLIDVINDLEFPGGEQLLEYAVPAARNIARLKARASNAGIPTVYVNDNFGRWRSDFKKLVEHCLDSKVRGKPIVELLAPDDNDYFVLKPRHSGFFSTALDLLLQYLGSHTLILAGFAGNNCVLFTANDAYMRGYKLLIPRDCSASNEASDNEAALHQMQQVLKADIRPADEIEFEKLAK